MAKIIFQGGGFGDFLCCFKALYAIKCLFPNDELLIYHSGIPLDFMQKVGFIDGVIDSNEVSIERLRAMNPDIFITNHRSGKFFREILKLNFRRIIAHPHWISFTSRKIETPFPYFRAKKYMADIVLKLVRVINPKHYDKNFAKIDFGKMRDFLPQDSRLTTPFFQSIDFPYKKIIGINAFSNHKESVGVNFYYKDWYYLAVNLARSYPQFLFVLLNFSHNPLQFNNIANLPNLKIFVNDANIASLVSISMSLDYLISIDTGNVHLCNILQIPTLVFIDKAAQYRFGGGQIKDLQWSLDGKKLIEKP
ncbi:glycosyltransferase family 9 protein [Helicobacter sp. 23-1044]